MLNFLKRNGLTEGNPDMSGEQLSLTDQIGTTAGQIWQLLATEGPISITKLAKSVDSPRDLTMQAVGWLARENKIEIVQEKRLKLVSLRPEELINVA